MNGVSIRGRKASIEEREEKSKPSSKIRSPLRHKGGHN